MNVYKKLFQSTVIYGLATVIPKMVGFIMARYHIEWLPQDAYAHYTFIFPWIMFFNVVLSFGMETAFFNFYNTHKDKKQVIQNSMWFLTAICIVFLLVAYSFKSSIDAYFEISSTIVDFLLWILVLDALVVIPFAVLRAESRPIIYSIIKIANVLINMALSVFFLYLVPEHFQYLLSEKSNWFVPHFEVGYLFLSNLLASVFTLLVFIKLYRGLKFRFDFSLGRQMISYSFPLMIAGLAFVINETFDKVALKWLLPENFKILGLASYGAIYKIGVFMILFRMAYALGVEPFFFSYAKNEDAPQKYAMVTKYFIIFGSSAMLGIIVLSDFIKTIYIPQKDYWFAMEIVPHIILANLMLGIYTNLSVWYKLRNKTKVGAYLSILGAVVTLILNFILVPLLGLLGAAITNLIAYGAMMLVSYILGQKYYPIPYDKKSIALYLGISVVFSFVYFYIFRENYWVGSGFILLYGLIIGVKENIFYQLRLKLNK